MGTFREFRPKYLTIGILTACVMLIGCIGISQPANALPAFARQTGQQCAACHNGFPELTPYGRLFKLNAYTFGGGTSPYMPLAVMTYGSFTNTQAAQEPYAAPHYAANNNFAVDQTSIFFGGQILPNLGAFIQATYDGVARLATWDNTDIRYARSFNMFDAETVWGVSLNNNPTVQDLWNTTPAWRYPYVASALAPTPGAATMIEGAWAQQVVGLTTYAMWNRTLYLEGGGYMSLSPSALWAMGVSPGGTSSIDGVAPYWRLAVTNDWRRNSIEAGLFGMAARVVPGRIEGFGADQLTDFGVDLQYQYLSDVNSFSVQASAIFENQILGASYSSGVAANTHNTLESYNAKATYAYDQTYYTSLGGFKIQGTPDGLLYAGNPGSSPNSSGFIGEIDYVPFNRGGPAFWPWLNMKLGLQYTYYTQFDGYTGAAATNNNTLYAFAWFAF